MGDSLAPFFRAYEPQGKARSSIGHLAVHIFLIMKNAIKRYTFCNHTFSKVPAAFLLAMPEMLWSEEYAILDESEYSKLAERLAALSIPFTVETRRIDAHAEAVGNRIFLTR